MSGEQITSKLCVQLAVIQELGPGPISQGGGVDDEDSLAYVLTIAPAHEGFTEPDAVVDQDAVVVAEYARGAPEPVSLEGREVYAGLALAPGFLFDVGVVAVLSLERPCCWRSQRREDVA